MGQAKKRGTFDERKAEAQRLEAERMGARRLELAARRKAKAMDPRAKRARNNLAAMVAIIAGLGVGLGAAPAHPGEDKS